MFDSRSLRSVVIVATVAVIAAGREKAPEYQGEGPKMEFVRIPAGSFHMGSPSSEEGREDNEGPVHQVQITKPFYMGREGPVHQVQITKPFYMGRYEVTQAQWKAVMGTTLHQQRAKAVIPWNVKGEGPEHPIYYVSWEEAVEFCKRLGREFRLPTEAEWEYACRAGTQTRFYYGDDPNCTQLDQYAWCYGNSDNTTHPVGQKKPNAWGLYDMHGNVSELCSDWFTLDYENAGSVDLTGPGSGHLGRVTRGGSWLTEPARCRSASRTWADSLEWWDLTGLRVVFAGKVGGGEKTLKISLPKKTIEVVPDVQQESGIQRAAGSIVTGVVRDQAGIPVDGVQLEIIAGDYLYPRVYAKGQFELYRWPGSPKSDSHRLLARHEQRNLAVLMEIEEDANAFDVELKPGLILTGKIVDSNGKAVEGARVIISKPQTSDWSARYLSRLKTDAEGRFEFRALPPGYDYVLSAGKLHHRPAQTEVRSEDARDNRVNVAIVLARGNFSVSGMVVDASGKPVADAFIWCTGKGQVGINSHTDANGKFKADGIFVGTVNVMASVKKADGQWAGGSVSVEAGATDVKVVLGVGEWATPPKGRTCFPAGTDVWVNGELVRISEVVPGRTVGKHDCAAKTVSFGQIEKLQEHAGTFECRDILLENGNLISVVDAHCFMLESGWWIAAQDLRSGHRLRTLNGVVSVKSVTIRAMPFVGKVYNLKISNSDRYAIGKDGVIVRDY